MANKEEGMTKETIVKSQANYKGNSAHDLVSVTFITDGSFYKKGDTDLVHPATAELFKAKGLIKDYEKYTPPKKGSEKKPD